MQTSGGFIVGIIKLSARMQGSHHDSFCGNSFFMAVYRNSSTLITNRTGAVFSQCDINFRSISGQVLIHGIV